MPYDPVTTVAFFSSGPIGGLPGKGFDPVRLYRNGRVAIIRPFVDYSQLHPEQYRGAEAMVIAVDRSSAFDVSHFLQEAPYMGNICLLANDGWGCLWGEVFGHLIHSPIDCVVKLCSCTSLSATMAKAVTGFLDRPDQDMPQILEILGAA